MPTVVYSGREIRVRDEETVLEALERAGCKPPSSCRTGVCQSCLLRAVDGEPPEDSQRGLRPPLQSRDFFLPCVCRPDDDLVVVRPGEAEATVGARIVDRRRTGSEVAIVEVEPAESFAPRGGQFVNLVRADGLTRAYSVANLPDREGVLELHVRRVPEGRMSGWLHDDPVVGRSVELRGPGGECIYTGESERSLLLVGTGTGLAPLVGVVRDAIRRDHQGSMVLVHGVRGDSSHYYGDELASLEAKSGALDLQICHTSRAGGGGGEELEPVSEAVDEAMAELDDPVGYVCGSPEDVRALQKKLFLGGIHSDEIFSDPFVRGRYS